MVSLKFYTKYKSYAFDLSKRFIAVNRHQSTQCPQTTNGLVLGVYDRCDGGCDQEFTETGERLNEQTNGFLKDLLKKQFIPFGKAELFSGLGIAGMHHIAFASLGTKNPNKLNLFEQLNEEKENIRVAMAVGARLVQDEGATKIFVDGCSVPEAAAEGAILATYQYKANTSQGEKGQPLVEMFEGSDCNSWASGEINAECQNWARYLSHAPPNLKMPNAIANEVMDKLCKYDIRVDIRNKEWMALRKMTATLALIKGMCAPPILLEIGYCGDEPKVKPVVLVGKGNVFDSGGLYLKPYKGMPEFRADMAGAAAICGCIMAVARKRLPINLRGVVVLYQNMPSPMGLKPGDVVRDKHGVHIRVSDPDNDCRVVLSDVVSFSDYYSPSLIIDVGTFTKSTGHALGLAASATFTTTNGLWNEMQRAGLESGDRVWRFPMWKYFCNLNTCCPDVDMDNSTCVRGGDACQAAMFLRKFVPIDQQCCCPTRLPFIHIDCFNTGLLSQTSDEVEPYYRKAIKMGRPTRTLVQFLYHRACLLPKAKQAVKGTTKK